MMTYDMFWLRYLRAHARPATRWLHYVGSGLALLSVVFALVHLNAWFLVAAPVVGYGFAWGAHLAVEHNKPETFGHPLWSLASDYRMFALFLVGRLDRHLRRAGIG